MNPKLETLKYIGFFAITNDPTGFYFSDNTIRWNVEFGINLITEEGHSYRVTKQGYGHIDPLIDEIWSEATRWVQRHFPEYYEDIWSRYIEYADAERTVPEGLGCHQ